MPVPNPFNTTTYVTTDQANDYFAGRLNSTAWSNATPAMQATALLQATNAIDRLNFAGMRTSDYNNRRQLIGEDGAILGSDILAPSFLPNPAVAPFTSQPLEFPRDGNTVIPLEILMACCEIALALLDGVDPEIEGVNLRSVAMGFEGVHESFNHQSTLLAYRHGIPSVTAWNYLYPYLADPSEIRGRRVN